jgi:hypothetical protein
MSLENHDIFDDDDDDDDVRRGGSDSLALNFNLIRLNLG